MLVFLPRIEDFVVGSVFWHVGPQCNALCGVGVCAGSLCAWRHSVFTLYVFNAARAISRPKHQRLMLQNRIYLYTNSACKYYLYMEKTLLWQTWDNLFN